MQIPVIEQEGTIRQALDTVVGINFKRHRNVYQSWDRRLIRVA